MDVFDNDEDRLLYLQLIAKEMDLHGVEILAWCLMTNHVHFIAVPQAADSLAKTFGEAHKLYSRMKNFREEVRGYLFQGRFRSCVLNDRHLIAAARYIEQNPVRASMVKKPWDYRWSSARFHLGMLKSDPLVKDRSLLGMVSDWHALLTGDDRTTDEKLRAGVKIGRPMGDEAFVQSLEEITGRTLFKGKPGKRPGIK